MAKVRKLWKNPEISCFLPTVKQYEHLFRDQTFKLLKKFKTLPVVKIVAYGVVEKIVEKASAKKSGKHENKDFS